MKALKTAVFLLALSCAGASAAAQSDNAVAARRALLFADSLNNAFRYNKWNEFINLSYPGVVRYYGGAEGFREYIKRARSVNSSIVEEKKERIELLQLVNDIREWQCVIRKTRETIIDGRKADVISYMVGQSKDTGQSWKYFDVAYNSVENVIYIMPDISDKLFIPERQIIFERDQLTKKN
ncbi:MAG: hypothetical protein H0X41_03515 [Chitinophagaceae bacterium]|nr:hypothetical protein [Chitinophagaceae bacterium]